MLRDLKVVGEYTIDLNIDNMGLDYTGMIWSRVWLTPDISKRILINIYNYANQDY
jgi:hypothetical protein